jgi:hypothetical protein
MEHAVSAGMRIAVQSNAQTRFAIKETEWKEGVRVCMNH